MKPEIQRPARDGETLSDEPDFTEMSDAEVADYWCKVCGEVEDENETLRAEAAALRAECALRDGMIDSLRADVAHERAEPRAARAECARLRAERDDVAERFQNAQRVWLRRHTRLSQALGMDPGYSVDATINEAIERLAARAAAPTPGETTDG